METEDDAWALYELHAVNGEEAKRLFLYENGNNKDTCGNYFYTSDELDIIKGKILDKLNQSVYYKAYSISEEKNE